MKKLFVALVLSLAIYCGKPPTVPPIPTPTAPSSPGAPNLTPLRASSSGFFDATGRLVRLKGVSYIPPDSKVHGWPSWIDRDILEEVARAGGNFVAVRLGPFSRDGEGIAWVAYESVGDLSRVNLDNWNPVFWNQVRSFTEDALRLGIYVEFDLIDAWVLERPHLSPWTLANNVNGYDAGNCGTISRGDLDERQRQWLNKIAGELGRYPNVLFQVSNESGAGNCAGALNPQWERSVIAHMRGVLGSFPRPIGTNSEDAGVEDFADYVQRHACSVQLARGKPTGVNEWNCGLGAAEFCEKVRSTPDAGWFLLWGDGMGRAEWEEALKCLRD